MIKSYIVFRSGFTQEIECDDKGMPISKKKRAHPRRFIDKNEAGREQEYINQIKSQSYNQEKSAASNWIKSNFPEGMYKYESTRSLAKLFSILFEMPFPREVYRRKKSCMYWLDENLKKIYNELQRMKIYIIFSNGKRVELKAPTCQFGMYTLPIQRPAQSEALPSCEHFLKLAKTPKEPIKIIETIGPIEVRNVATYRQLPSITSLFNKTCLFF